jgi:hypothetical protein
MNKKYIMFICVVFLFGGITSALAEARTDDSSLTKQVYRPRRLSVARYRRRHYSRLKFTPRRYTWQRNLGKRTAYRNPPIPLQRAHKRLRIPARGPDRRRRATVRRPRLRHREAHAERVRTVRGGLGTGNRETPPIGSPRARFRRISPRRYPRARWIAINKPKNKG